jgi:hypothetical protein
MVAERRGREIYVYDDFDDLHLGDHDGWKAVD